MAAFLEQPAVVGMQNLEASQRRECVGDPSKVALADGDQVQNVPVLRDFDEQRLRGRERLCELALLEQPARAANFGLDARFRWFRFRSCHGLASRRSGFRRTQSRKKAGITARL